jgi:hypothetical protein
MRFKGTAVLLLVALGVGAYVFFYEIRGTERRDKAKQEENRIWKVESSSIQEIALTSAASANQRITAARSGEKEWKITSPRPLDADSEELNRICSSAAEVNRESVVEANAPNLAVFGLEPAQTKLEFKTKDGKEYKIRFGNNNPTGSSTYAALEGKHEVFLVANFLASTFGKKLDDLRNRSVLSFDQFDARSVDLKSEKGALQLVKDNDRWWLQGKERWAADSSGVNGVLGALSNTKMKEFFDEDPDQYQTLGFDKPTVEVGLTIGKDKALKHLVVGLPKSKLLKKGEKPKPEPPKKAEAKKDKKDADKKDAEKKDEATPSTPPEIYIARDDSRKELFFVEKEFVDKLLKTPADLRDKALAAFQRWDIDDIVLKNAKGEFHFSKPSGSGDWVLGDAKKKTKWDAVNGVLDALEKPVKSFLDTPSASATYGLDAPRVHVTLKQTGAVKAEVSFGKETPEGVYASVRGESSVKVADKESLQKLDKGESDFIEPPAPATPNPHTPAPKK